MRNYFTILFFFFTAICYGQRAIKPLYITNQCDTLPINGYVNITNYKGCAINWTRVPINGITPLSSNGSSRLINERLINNTDTIINVQYDFTAQCPQNPAVNFNVIVPIKPSPKGYLTFYPSKTLVVGETLKLGFVKNENTKYISEMISFGDGANEQFVSDNSHYYSANKDTTYLINVSIVNNLGCETIFRDTLKIQLYNRTDNLPLKNSADIYVYPNPYFEDLYFKYTIPKNENALLTINDASGKIFYRNNLALIKGANIVRLTGLTLDPGKLYHLVISSESIFYEENIFKK